VEIGLIDGFANAFTLANLGYALIGCLLGTMVGLLPGLGPGATMAILLPISFQLDPIGAVIILSGIFYGAMYAGSTTAILINVPGEVASVVTAIDGYQMTKQGRAGPALAIAAIGSYIAGIAGTIALAAFAPLIADIIFYFGPAEYFALVVFAMTALISFAGDSLLKAVAVTVVGLWLAAVGSDPLSGAVRLNFGGMSLMQGFDAIPVFVGLFGISEVLATAGGNVARPAPPPLGSWLTFMPRGIEMARGLAASVRGTISGFVLGLLPGMVPALTAYLAYDIERKVSKTPERFGQGAIEGVAAPEAANNATAMAGFIPLFALGVPTSPALAILLSALVIHGLPPGPALFTQHAAFTWTVIASIFIANTMLLVLNLPLVGLWSRLSAVPYRFLGPVILVVCMAAAYASRYSLFDVFVAIGFGFLGLAMRYGNWPMTPLVLGFLLGPMLEQSLRNSLELSGGSPMIFLERWICIALMAAGAIVLAGSLYLRRRSAAMKTLVAESANEV